MSDETTPERFREPQKKRPRRRGRRFGLWRMLSLLFLMLFMFLAGLSLTGRALIMPDWLTRQLEIRINNSIFSGRLNIGQVLFQVSRSGIPSLKMRTIGIFNENGAELVQLNEVGARVSLPGILDGKLQADSISVSGAQMVLRRLGDGRFDLSLGGGSGAGGTLPDMLDALDRAFSLSPLDSVGKLTADALTISVQDVRSGRIWQITDGHLQLSRLGDGLDLSIAFDVFNGTEDLAEVVIGVRTDAATQAASIGATFRNAAAQDIALQSPVLSFLGLLDAPISGALRTGFRAGGELDSFAGTLEIGNGALQPNPDTTPVNFDSGKTYFTYDPELEKISFSELSVKTDAASVVAKGHAFLRDYQDGWPSTLIAQFSLADLVIDPEGLFDKPAEFSEGAMDFRMRLSPFSVDIGQFVLVDGDVKLLASGAISADGNGWRVSADLALNKIETSRLMAFWPGAMVPRTRAWLAKNVVGGVLHDLHAMVRISPQKPARRSIGFRFQDATIRYIKNLPLIENAAGYSTIIDNNFTLVLEKGAVRAPKGGSIGLAGSTMQIRDISQNPAHATLKLAAKSKVTATLSLLNEPPFRVLRNSNLPVDMTEGDIQFGADVGFRLKNKVMLEDVTYKVDGTLHDISSEVLVRDRLLSAKQLTLSANNARIEISGPARLGKAVGDMTWHQNMGPAHVGKSRISGTVELSQDFVDEFRIGLPKGTVSGAGLGQFDIGFVRGKAPELTLSSDLNRLALSIPQIGWKKPLNSTGSLDVVGHLGETPGISKLELKAPGLTAIGGKVELNESGGLKTAQFSRVQIESWLDAPVTMTGRGKGAAPKLLVLGGTLDVRKTSFGGGGGKSARSGSPISMQMDEVIISQGITLTGFTGDFTNNGGLSGDFTANVNGKTRITGGLAPDKNGVAVRIQSPNAGGVFKAAGILKNVKGGLLDMTLRPQKANGVYRGKLKVTDTRLVNASVLTEILNVVSIVGLLDQLNGPGLSFSEVDATFELSPKSVNLIRSSAVGSSLGVALDGVYDLTTSLMDMQGVVSPVYFLNGIGRMFSSRRGEGLFGFSFRLTGTGENPKVQVNPLSILTPGMFRDIFRRPPPQTTQ